MNEIILPKAVFTLHGSPIYFFKRNGHFWFEKGFLSGMIESVGDINIGSSLEIIFKRDVGGFVQNKDTIYWTSPVTKVMW